MSQELDPQQTNGLQLGRFRWFGTLGLAAATFSLVLLIDHDPPRPEWEQQVRPVVPRIQPKPFVEPKGHLESHFEKHGAKQQELAASLPSPPLVAAKGPLFRSGPLAATTALDKLDLPYLGPPPANSPAPIPTTPPEGSWKIDAAGQIYHLIDGGQSWERVFVQDGQGGQSGPITSLQATSQNEAQAGTATGEQWLTKDAGRSWMKK